MLGASVRARARVATRTVSSSLRAMMSMLGSVKTS